MKVKIMEEREKSVKVSEQRGGWKTVRRIFRKRKEERKFAGGKTLKSFSSSESFSSFEFAVWKFQFALSCGKKFFRVSL